MLSVSDETKILGTLQPEYHDILTPEALQFLLKLQRAFNPVRLQLVEARKRRQQDLNRGASPTFLSETAHIRNSDWQVAPTPPHLQKHWVEITGPVDCEMMINARNC